jgi:epoxyqueuosine reductase
MVSQSYGGQKIFKKVFRKSAVKRTKFAGLKRNLEFLKPG